MPNHKEDTFAPGQYVRILSSKGEVRGVRVVKRFNGRQIEFTEPLPTGTQPGDQVQPWIEDFINLDRLPD